jgi:magnesium transporter
MSKSARSTHHRLPGLTHKVPLVPVTFTLAETQSFLLSHKGEFDTMDYIYVSDTEGRLTGVFSIKDIYRHPPSANVSTVHKKSPLVTASMESHPEEIAYLALRHGIKAVPIVDEHGKLLGVIPHDAINRTLYRELREDILHLAGVSRGHLAFDNIFEISLLRAVRHRLPWLVVGTIGGLLIAQIIGQYEQTLRDNLVLAAFVPLVVYIADAVGTQMEAFVIRDFALFRRLEFARYFTRQLLIVLIIAFFLCIVIALTGFVIYRRADIATILGLAVAGSTMSALFSGLIIPLIFRRMNMDPANASGPLGTIIQDALSVVIYFSIASLLL